MSERPETLVTRIKGLGSRIMNDKDLVPEEILSEAMRLRYEILQNSGDGMNADVYERTHKLVLMMQLVDDLLKDRLNLERWGVAKRYPSLQDHRPSHGGVG